jgi:hypothetical protein
MHMKRGLLAADRAKKATFHMRSQQQGLVLLPGYAADEADGTSEGSAADEAGGTAGGGRAEVGA